MEGEGPPIDDPAERARGSRTRSGTHRLPPRAFLIALPGSRRRARASVVRLGEAFEKSLRELRAEHGFTQDEDDRLWSAIAHVVAARPLENPATAAGFQSLRDMQAKGGEEGKIADEMLKSMESEEKEALAAARASYGDACVEVLSRRVKELAQFQIDSITELSQAAATEE